MMHKKLFNIICVTSISIFGLVACEADKFETEPLSSLSVTHAAAGAPALDLLVDGKITTANRLAFRTTSISKSGSALVYLPVISGDRSLKFTADTGKSNLAELNMPFNLGGIYSIFLYDTVVAGKVKLLTLSDNLTLPTGINTHFRFLPLAPNAGPLDMTLVRGTLYDDTTLSPTSPIRSFVPSDSVTVSNKTYVGTNPDVNALSAFTPIAGSSGISAIPKSKGFANLPAASKNNRYQIKIKTAGTQNVLTRIETATFSLTTGKIYTIYVSGTAQNTSLSASVINHY